MSCPVCSKSHNAACHACPHKAEIAAGKYRDTEFDKTPCSGCMSATGELSHAGRSFVSFDHAHNLRLVTPATGAADDTPPAGHVAAFASLLRDLSSMPSATRDIVLWRFRHQCGEPGFSYREIGQRMALPPQAIEQRHKRAIQAVPALRWLFGEKVAGQVRRARSR